MCLHNAQMKHSFLALLAAGFLAVTGAGCYSTPQGHMKPTLMPFAKDKLEYRFEKTVDQILNAAREVLNKVGTINSDDVKKRVLEAKIDTRTVWVAVDPVEPNIGRMFVQVRTKGGTTDIDLASEIATQIALQLR